MHESHQLKAQAQGCVRTRARSKCKETEQGERTWRRVDPTDAEVSMTDEDETLRDNDSVSEYPRDNDSELLYPRDKESESFVLPRDKDSDSFMCPRDDAPRLPRRRAVLTAL